MTLDECRAALETAKLAAAEGHASPAAKNLLDWAEDVQDFLEAVFAPVADAPLPVADPALLCGDCKGEGHVRVEDDPLQIWDLCPACGGLGKVQKPESLFSPFKVISRTPHPGGEFDDAVIQIGDDAPIAVRLKKPLHPTPCYVCRGRGKVYEEGEGYICSHCNGTGHAR